MFVVTGKNGQVGREVTKRLASRTLPFEAFSRSEFNISNVDHVERHIRPDVDAIINCAAFTAVDDAEQQTEEAWDGNSHGPALLAQACKAEGVRLLHLSTDYVFDGKAQQPYKEDDPTGPVTVYGESKLAGEVAISAVWPDDSYILRTAWVYSSHGSNFVRTMLRLAAKSDTVSVVTDQIGQPTWAGDIAEALITVALARSGAVAPGIYHFSGEGSCSWYEFAREIFRLGGHDPDRVLTTTSSEFSRPAQRPPYSVLSHEKWIAAGLPPIKQWREMLESSAVIQEVLSEYGQKT